MAAPTLTNPVKDKLAAGGTALGLGVRMSRSAEIARIAHATGHDFLFIDVQHSLFNLETITTHHAMAEMVPVAAEHGLGLVFGRVDFAGSMGRERDFVDSEEMTAHILAAATAARDNNLPMVVGGAVSPDSIPSLKRILAVRLDRFETRKVIFQADTALNDTDLAKGLTLAMEFELLWLKNKRDYYAGIASEDEKRIAMMEARQQKAAY
jgi:SpoVK/Ycf46/Vps4 family AAA+-type ATPase